MGKGVTLIESQKNLIVVQRDGSETIVTDIGIFVQIILQLN